MICFAVTFEFAAADVPQVLEILRALTAATRKEPGCRAYVPHQSKENPNRFFLYEKYDDDAAVAAHRDSAHFTQYATNGLYKLVKERKIEFFEVLA